MRRLTLATVMLVAGIVVFGAERASAATIDVRGDGTGNAIGKAVNAAQPGDVVVVHAGIYGRQSITKKAIAPIVVRAAAGETMTIAGFDVKAAKNIEIRDFAAPNVLGSNHIHSSSFITLANNRIDAPKGKNGVACYEGVSTRLYYSAIGVCVASNNITITDNVITRGFRGIALYGGATPTGVNAIHHVLIAGNDLSDALQDDLIQTHGTNEVIIEDNFFHDLNDTLTPTGGVLHNDAIEVLGSTNYVIRRNEMTWPDGDQDPTTFDGNQAIIIGPGRSATSNVVVENNLVHHWNGPAMSVAGANIDIANNTLLAMSNRQGIYLDTKSANVRIWNNIISKLQRENASVAIPTFEQNNVIYRQPGTAALGASTDPARNLIRDSAFDSNFVSTSATAANRYVLKATSRAVNSGVVIPETPEDDWEGALRNVGLPDRGARETRT